MPHVNTRNIGHLKPNSVPDVKCQRAQTANRNELVHEKCIL
jgi:hypothetical protein